MKALTGTWQFNDIIIAPSTTDGLRETISFSLGATLRQYGDVWISCNEISVTGTELKFSVTSIEPSVPDYNVPLDLTVHKDGWMTDVFSESIKTIAFNKASGVQYVSDEFYEWFTANAKEAVLTLSGTWRLNDVLGTLNQASRYHREEIDFTMPYIKDGTHYLLTCDTMTRDQQRNFLSVMAIGSQPPMDDISTGNPTEITPYTDETGWESPVSKMITFVGTQQVSDYLFYRWFVTNATPAKAVTVSYKGRAIAVLESGQTATLNCTGKTMSSDVVVEVMAGESNGVDIDTYSGTVEVE